MTMPVKPPIKPMQPQPPPPTDLFKARQVEWETKAGKFSALATANQAALDALNRRMEAALSPVQRTPLLKQLIPNYETPSWLRWVHAVPGAEEITKRMAAPVVMQQLRNEFDTVANQMEYNDFYRRLYTEVPYGIQLGAAVTANEVLAKLTPPPNMPKDELDTVTDTINDMVSTIQTGRGALPEMAAEAELPELPELVPPQPKPRPLGIQRITVDAIRAALMAPRIPEPVMTNEEYKKFLYDSGQVENLGDSLDLAQQADELIKSWQDRNSQIAAFKEGIAKMPDYKLADLLKTMVVQPGLALAETFGVYFEHVSQPLSGLVYKTFIPDIEAEYQRLRKSEGTWEALAHAWQAWKAPGASNAAPDWILKYMLMEAVLDPLTYLGWGLATRVFRPLGAFGRFVGAAERGFMEILDLPLDALKSINMAKWSPAAIKQLHLEGRIGKLLGTKAGEYVIPKTPGQIALIEQRRGGQFFKQAIELWSVSKGKPKLFHQFSKKEMADFIRDALKYVEKNPQSQEPIAQAGRELLKHKTLDMDTIKNWAAQLKTKLSPEEITNVTNLSVNDLFEDVLFNRKQMTTKEAAGKLLQILDGESSEATLKVAQKLLENRVTRITIEAKAFANAATSAKGMQALMLRNYRYSLAVQKSIAYTERVKMGRFSGLLTDTYNDVQRVWANTIDRMVVSKFAEAYLTFGMYGPMNILEDYIRSMLGGVFPGRASAERFAELAAGLAYDIDLTRGLGAAKPTFTEMLGFRSAEASRGNNWILTIGNLPLSIPTFIATGGKVTPAAFARVGRELLVHRPGMVGMDIRRNFILNRYTQILAESGGEQVAKLLNLVKTFKGTADKKLNRKVEQYVADAVLSGDPDMIRKAVEVFTRRNIIRSEISHVLMRHPGMPSPVRQLWLDRFDDGAIFRDVPLTTRLVVRDLVDDAFGAKTLRDKLDTIGRSIPTGEEWAPSLADAIERWYRHPQDEALQLIGKTASTNPTYLSEVDRILSARYTSGYIKVFRGKSREGGIGVLEREFTNVTSSKSVAKEFTEAGKMLEVNINVSDVVAIASTGESELVVRSSILKDRMANPIRPSVVRDAKGRFMKASGSIEAVTKEADDMLSNYFMKSPELATREFEDLATLLTELEVRNPEEMAQVMWSLNKVSEVYGAMPKQILAHASVMSRGLPFEERNAIINKALDDIVMFKEKGGSSIDKVIARIKEQQSKINTPEYVASSNRLFDLQTAKRVRLGELNDDMNAWRRAYFADASKDDLKSSQFWETFYDNLDNHIHNTNLAATEYDGLIENAIEGVDRAGGIPRQVRPAIKVTDRALSTQDVANLLGARGDDLSRAILDTLTIQNDKDMFIAYVMGKVRQGDKGFTKEAVAQVYDQLTHSLGLKPESVSWLSAQRLELDATRRELHELYNAKLYPKEQIDAVGKYVEETAKGVEGLVYTGGKPTAQAVVDAELARYPKELRGRVKSITEVKGGADVSVDNVGNIRLDYGDVAGLDGQLAHEIGHINYRRMEIETSFQTTMQGKVNPSRADELYAEAFEEFVTGKPMDLSRVPKELRGVPFRESNPGLVDDALKFIRGERLKVGKRSMLPTKGLNPEYADYNQMRQAAMDEAHKWYYKEYVDYTHANAFDSMMKGVYPFYTYESQRWQWLPRSFIRHPVVATELARWNDNSDYGYVQIPGTSVAVNPLRGTVFGTMTTRLMRRDYPEYYDSLPFAGNLIEFNDFLSRYGFYPGAHVGIPLAIMGGRESQFGEVLPATYKTLLDGAIAMFPKSEAIKAISQSLFNDRFRDYLTMRDVSTKGGNGSLLYAKIKAREKLTDEEQNMWDTSRGEVSWYSAGFEQFGLFKLRPEEQVKMQADTTKAIQEMTGFTPDQQSWLRDHGYRLWDMVGGMSPTEQDTLKALDYYKWAGATRPLLPGKQQDVLDRIELGWDDVRRYTETISQKKLQLQREFLSGARSPRDYSDGLLGLYTNQRNYIDTKIADNPLMDIENRKDYYKQFNIAQPVLHPMRELLNLYFNIELKDIKDPETGEIVKDWDTFWAEREAIEDAIPDEFREEWKSYLAKNSTRVEELRREVSSKYFRKYNELWTTILERYSEEEQSLIKEYLYLEKMGQNLARQAEIQGMVTAKGTQLVSSFRSDISNARKALRYANPTLDAWLNYWARVSSFLTPQAESIYKQLLIDTGRRA